MHNIHTFSFLAFKDMNTSFKKGMYSLFSDFSKCNK